MLHVRRTKDAMFAAGVTTKLSANGHRTRLLETYACFERVCRRFLYDRRVGAAVQGRNVPQTGTAGCLLHDVLGVRPQLYAEERNHLPSLTTTTTNAYDGTPSNWVVVCDT